MSLMQANKRIIRWTIIPLSIMACVIGAVVHVNRSVRAGQAAPASARNITLGVGRPGSLYAVTLWVKNPAQMQGNDAVHVTVNDVKGEVESKWLHAADLDLYLTLRPRAEGPVTVSLSSPSAERTPEISSALSKILQAAATSPGSNPDLTRGVIAAAPNVYVARRSILRTGPDHLWQRRRTALRSIEERRRLCSDGQGFSMVPIHLPRKATAAGLLRFECDGSRRPAGRRHFSVGQGLDGKPDVVPFTDGEFVYQVEATQNYPGLYKFRTRILQPGQEYYVRVARESSGLPIAHLPL